MSTPARNITRNVQKDEEKAKADCPPSSSGLSLSIPRSADSNQSRRTSYSNTHLSPDSASGNGRETLGIDGIENLDEVLSQSPSKSRQRKLSVASIVSSITGKLSRKNSAVDLTVEDPPLNHEVWNVITENDLKKSENSYLLPSKDMLRTIRKSKLGQLGYKLHVSLANPPYVQLIITQNPNLPAELLAEKSEKGGFPLAMGPFCAKSQDETDINAALLFLSGQLPNEVTSKAF